MKLSEQFHKIINEKAVEAFKNAGDVFTIFENPTLQDIKTAFECRGVINEKGNFYIILNDEGWEYPAIHIDICRSLSNHGYIENDYPFDHDGFPERQYPIVMVQRKGRTNKFYLSESYPFTEDNDKDEWKDNYKKWILPLMKKAQSKTEFEFIPEMITF